MYNSLFTPAVCIQVLTSLEEGFGCPHKNRVCYIKGHFDHAEAATKVNRSISSTLSVKDDTSFKPSYENPTAT